MLKESEREILVTMRRTLEENKAMLTLMNQDKLAEIKKTLFKEGAINLQFF